MHIVPVLDVMKGQVVRGIGGRRDEYCPVVSRLTSSTLPLEMARAFREQFGLHELYVADLDAIGGQTPAYGLFEHLLRAGFHLWVDAGLGSHCEVPRTLSALGVQTIVAGLECLCGPVELKQVIEEHSAERIVFSLDAQKGTPLASAAWLSPDLWIIAEQAIRQGTRRLLVLDLAAVGMNEGSCTDDLCARLRSRYAQIEISTGGGVRGAADLRRLSAKGADKVLVASALHDGRLTWDELAEF